MVSSVFMHTLSSTWTYQISHPLITFDFSQQHVSSGKSIKVVFVFRAQVTMSLKIQRTRLVVVMKTGKARKIFHKEKNKKVKKRQRRSMVPKRRQQRSRSSKKRRKQRGKSRLTQRAKRSLEGMD